MPSLNAAELERRLRAVVPAVRVVRERLLRKLLHWLADQGEPVAINTGLPLWVSASQAREADFFPIDADNRERLLFVADPADLLAGELTTADVLRFYWRLLFRAAVFDAALRSPLPELPTHEIRFVLESDHVIPHGADDRTLYAAFAAVYLDLQKFDPNALPSFFPTACPPPALPADELLAATRPEGASDPAPKLIAGVYAEPEDTSPPTGPAGPLTAAADQAASIGNYVRAAILRSRAARGPNLQDRDKHRTAARSAIRNGLVKRLAPILGWNAAASAAWGSALVPLLDPASKGIWPRAARALYDLQKIVTDLQGELSTVDPIEWLRTLGRRPLRRPLTRARAVVLLMHLKKALANVRRSRIPVVECEHLEQLFHVELHSIEARIRAELGPIIRRVLEDAGFRPANLPEQIAKDKIVAELLDRICERGFLRFADLRDAIARNQLKMPDLSLGELVRGDPLLRADAKLAEELDGVYRRGEIYLRAIQRGTSLAFGTRIGRWLALFVVFPFGGAYMAVEGAKYLRHEVGKAYSFVRKLLPRTSDEAPLIANPIGDDESFGFEEELGAIDPQAAPAPPPEPAHGGFTTPTLLAVAILGVIFLLLLHSPAFRSLVWHGLKAIGRALRFAFVELPQRVWRSQLVRTLRSSAVTRFIGRHFGTAIGVSLLVALQLAVLGAGPRQIATWSVLSFAGVTLFVNLPTGRRFEDRAFEAVADTWRDLHANLIPGFLGWLVDLFRAVAGLVERALYAIDEWFRFRQGQSGGSLAVKAAIAVVWFPIAYVFRFAFYLLFEPQVNPLKHFPVVTVSHKLLLPQVGILSDLTGLSVGTMTAILTGIPGVFGFIAWELKENWRLYAANRSQRLPRVVLGHHGETMRGLLRPGFHSGTVPKLFRKLRTAIRKAARGGRPANVGKPTHELEEVRHAIELFVERELVPLLRAAVSWKGLTPTAGEVHVGVQSIMVELAVPELGEENLRIAFEHRDGTITARCEEPNWAKRLTGEQTAVLEMALAGFRAMACVHGEATWNDWVDFWQKQVRE